MIHTWVDEYVMIMKRMVYLRLKFIKLKDASRENDGKKSQIIEWLSTNSGSIQRNTNIN